MNTPGFNEPGKSLTDPNLWAFREAVASVSLSHDADCNCLTCRAGKGDERAMMMLWTSLHGGQ